MIIVVFKNDFIIVLFQIWSFQLAEALSILVTATPATNAVKTSLQLRLPSMSKIAGKEPSALLLPTKMVEMKRLLALLS